MEHSENIWSATAFTVGGAEVTVLELAAFVAALAVVVWIWRRTLSDRDGEHAVETRAYEAGLARLAESQAALDAKLATLFDASAKSQESLRKTVDERLDSVAKRLGDGLTATSKTTTESLAKLNERLALIDRAQKNIETLSGEVSGLQALLANKQSRGAFGEIQMQDIVKNYMPPNAFEFQSTLSNGARVDCLIKLPNPPGSVPIDAKFPLENWRQFAEAEDEASKKTAAQAFRAIVLKHIKDISEKYLIPGETADSALMFVPSEAVYATIHADFADLVDKSFRARVMIVSPTTFMATLHTMRAVMRDARMREQAHVIQREVALLGDDVSRLDDRVGKLQTHFNQANEDVRQIRISTDKVVTRSGRIGEVHVEDEGRADELPTEARPRLVGS